MLRIGSSDIRGRSEQWHHRYLTTRLQCPVQCDPSPCRIQLQSIQARPERRSCYLRSIEIWRQVRPLTFARLLPVLSSLSVTLYGVRGLDVANASLAD